MRVKMKNILFVVSHIHFVRNYISNGILDKLQKGFNVTVLITSETKNIDLKTYKKVLLSEPSIFCKVIRNLIFDAFTVNEMGNNSAFALRFKRNKVFSLQKYQKKFKNINKHNIKNIALLFYTLSLDLNRYFCCKLSKILLLKYIKLLQKMDRINFDNYGNLSKFKNHLVVIPSSAYSHYDLEIIKCCKKLDLKTILLIDNWDNLSSKSVLWERPDYMAVWGPQTKKHAIEIQKMNGDHVFPLGTPRFEQYFETRDIDLNSNFNHKYILFVGTFLEFNELEALTIINDVISDNKEIFGETKLVYRPHPWRQGAAVDHIDKLKNVELDPQIKNSYLKGQKTFQPNLDYYPSLLKNAEFIIGGLTSMIIEASIYNIKYIALAYDDGNSFISQKEAYENYIHFKGVENLDNVYMCRQKEELPKVLLKYGKEKKGTSKNTERLLDYFITNNNNTYFERLKNILDKLS